MGQILKLRTDLFSGTEGVCAYHGTHMMRHASVDAWAQENSTLPALPVGNQAIFAGFRENA